MDGYKGIIKRNIIFIIFLCVIVVCFIKKDNYLPMNIVPYPDSYVEFTANDKVMEQTWLSQVKEIAAVSVPYIAVNDFQAEMKMTVIDSQNGNVITSESHKFQFVANQEDQMLFEFEPVDIKAGNQYVFRLEFENIETDNVLMIKSGTNYMGCSINGREVNQGIAFEVTYIKNSAIFWLFVSFFPFIGIGFLFMLLWDKKWEEVVGMSTAATIFIMFIAGLFGKLEAGIGVIYILAIIALIVAVILYNKKEKNIKDLISPGLVVYGVFVVLILINCRDMRLARWDEFSHWGLAAKDMFYSNSLAKHFDSTVMLKYYPPVATLIEYFFCYTNKLFSYNMVYVGFQIFMLNLLSAGLGICKKEKNYIVPVAMLILFLPIIFFNDVYNSIYADPLLAFGVAYVLICYFTEKMSVYNYIRVTGGLFLLTLIKDTGVVLAGLLTLVMLGDTLFQQYRKHKLEIKKTLLILTSTILVCIFFFIWQFFLSIPMERNIDSSDVIAEQGIEETETETMSVTGAIGKSNIGLEGILELFKGEAPEYRYTVIKNYIGTITGGNVYSFGVMAFSYMDLVIVISALMFLFDFKGWIYENDQRGISFGIFTFLAAVGYAGFLLVTYLFSFSEREALLLSSFARYLGSYAAGITIAGGVVLLAGINENKKKNVSSLIVIICAILMVATPFKSFLVKNMDTETTDEESYGYDDIAQILYSGGKKTDTVYFVCNGSDGYANFQFKNAIVPMQSSLRVYDLYTSKESYIEQLEIDEEKAGGSPYYLEVEEWAEQLLNYEYVVLFYPNDVFKDSYGELFSEPETIDRGTVYKVNGKKAEIVLDYIGKTGIKEFR